MFHCFLDVFTRSFLCTGTITDNPSAAYSGMLQFVTSAMFAYSLANAPTHHVWILFMNSVDVELQLLHVSISVLTKVPTIHVEHNSIVHHGLEWLLFQAGELTQRPNQANRYSTFISSTPRFEDTYEWSCTPDTPDTGGIQQTTQRFVSLPVKCSPHYHGFLFSRCFNTVTQGRLC